MIDEVLLLRIVKWFFYATFSTCWKTDSIMQQRRRLELARHFATSRKNWNYVGKVTLLATTENPVGQRVRKCQQIAMSRKNFKILQRDVIGYGEENLIVTKSGRI